MWWACPSYSGCDSEIEFPLDVGCKRQGVKLNFEGYRTGVQVVLAQDLSYRSVVPVLIYIPIPRCLARAPSILVARYY